MRAYGLPVRYLLRFLSYLIAAFQMLEPALGNVALAMLHTPQPPSLEAVLTILANDLVSHQRGAFTIVLYDYHLITAQPIHHTLDFLIEHFPLLMHLVIVTRVDPPLPLVRLRSHQRFTELGVPDLHFGQAEVREFLHLAMRVDLPPDIIDVLLDRTEGWVAGLQLAALSLRDCVDISAFLASFTGRHYAVFDYLSEEVLTRQPATVQSFLFSTCLLEHLCASLCDAVTGQTEGAAILERLGRDNIFLLSLDDERQWYRYHHLFAEVLRNRLRQSQPLLVPELHRRASTWYEQHGFLPDAVEHARAAHDICGANNAWVRWHRPPTQLDRGIACQRGTRSSTTLSLSAWLLLLTNQIDVAEMQLRDAKKILAALDDVVPSLSPENVEDGKCLRAERDTDEAMREGFWGEVAAIAATIALARQEVPLAIEQCHHALKHLSTGNFYVRGLLFVLLGQAYRVSGDLGAASQALAEVYTTSHVAGNVFLTVGAMVNLAEIYKMRDQLHQAARTWRQVIDLANTPDGRPLPFAGPAYIGMGKLLREWNDLQAATEYLTKGSELCQQGGIEGNVFDAFITLAFVWQALGDTKRAFEFLSFLPSYRAAASLGCGHLDEYQWSGRSTGRISSSPGRDSTFAQRPGGSCCWIHCYHLLPARQWYPSRDLLLHSLAATPLATLVQVIGKQPETAALASTLLK